MAQAAAALRRVGLRVADVDGDQRARASLVGADRTGRREACRLVGEDGLDVAAVASTIGVDWGTVMRAVREDGQPLVDDPARLAVVQGGGVDETAFLAANATPPRSS